MKLDQAGLEEAQKHGLSAEEYARARSIMGRSPNHTELGIFSVMWSEHCSYKSSKVWLKKLPTTGKRVICGPGENAGVILRAACGLKRSFNSLFAWAERDDDAVGGSQRGKHQVQAWWKGVLPAQLSAWD